MLYYQWNRVAMIGSGFHPVANENGPQDRSKGGNLLLSANL